MFKNNKEVIMNLMQQNGILLMKNAGLKKDLIAYEAKYVEAVLKLWTTENELSKKMGEIFKRGEIINSLTSRIAHLENTVSEQSKIAFTSTEKFAEKLKSKNDTISKLRTLLNSSEDDISFLLADKEILIDILYKYIHREKYCSLPKNGSCCNDDNEKNCFTKWLENKLNERRKKLEEEED